MHEVRLVGRISNSQTRTANIQIHLSAQIFASLSKQSLSGIVEPVTGAAKVEIRTAIGNLAFPENEFFLKNKKVSIQLEGSFLKVSGQNGSLIYEVNLPKKQTPEPKQSTSIPHLLQSMLKLQNQYQHHHKISESRYLLDIPEAILTESAGNSENAQIWHLTHNLTYSVLLLPLEVNEQEIQLRFFKKNRDIESCNVYHFEWEHESTGFARLDIMFYATQQRLDCAFISESKIDDTFKAELSIALTNYLELIGYSGEITFRNDICPEDSLLATVVREHCLNSAINVIA